MKQTQIIIMFIAILVVMVVSANSQEKLDPQKQQEMMAAYMELAKPGEEHKLLESLVGTWDIVGKMWTQPGTDPMTFTGVTINKMILGGRFLLLESKGGENEMYTETYNLAGFDRRHKKYTTIGLDTWGTYYVTAAGTYDEQTKTLKMYGEDEDPIMGFTQKFDFIVRFISPDKYSYETVFYDFPTPVGVQKEFKMMEIIHTQR